MKNIINILLPFLLFLTCISFPSKASVVSFDQPRGVVVQEKEEPKSEEEADVFSFVDIPAEYVHGNDSILSWIRDHIKYPEKALKKGKEGMVAVRFIVEINGEITNAKIQKSLDQDLDNEALRVILSMPNWKPAYNNGIPVRSYFTLPVTFKIPTKDNSDDNTARGVIVSDIPKTAHSQKNRVTPFKEAEASILNSPEDWVTSMNDICPIDMGMMGQLTSVVMDRENHTVTYNFITSIVNESLYSLLENPENQQKRADIVGAYLIPQFPLLDEWGFDIKYNFTSSVSTKTGSFILTNKRIKELKKLSKSQKDWDKLMLDTWLDDENMTMSMLGEELKGKVYIKDNYYTIEAPVPESDRSFACFELYQNTVKRQLNNLISNDPSMRIRIPVLCRNGLGVKYIFLDEEKNPCFEIIFNPDQLQEMNE